jgi:hypothetical protein
MLNLIATHLICILHVILVDIIWSLFTKITLQGAMQPNAFLTLRLLHFIGQVSLLAV